jgi:uncharacterized radical SAM superfamily Fe-S cluster-containing enzyme
MTLPEFEFILDKLLEYEGSVPVINLSGGEPTFHPAIEQFLQLAATKPMSVTVSTNGNKLLYDKALREVFKETDSIVALQFDGFAPATYRYLRGDATLVDRKLELIHLLETEGIKYSLVATVAKTVNEQEITQMVDFFFSSQALSLMFQPATFTGAAAKLPRVILIHCHVRIFPVLPWLIILLLNRVNI